jgi:hypothetical protein
MFNFFTIFHSCIAIIFIITIIYHHHHHHYSILIVVIFYVLYNRILFWSSGGLRPKIEQASLDGLDRITIVNLSGNNSFNDVSLDTTNKRIYWGDTGANKIESVDYSGRNRKEIVKISGMQPFGVDLYRSWLFWTDLNPMHSGLHMIDSSKQNNVTHENMSLAEGFAIRGNRTGITVFDISKQPAICK